MNGKQLKNSILQWAIQGKLVSQDPNDEPASILLERIRAEKARLVKEGKIKKDKNESIIFRGDDNSHYEKFLATGEVKCIDHEIPFEIPEGWEWCRLGAIGSWGSGATPSKGHPEFYGGSIPWLTTGELNETYVFDTRVKVTEKALACCSLRKCATGDVLIAMYGATIGKVAIAGCELTTNQACCACTPYYNYNKYLFYFLMSNKLNFIKMGEGGAQPNISKEKIVATLCPLPPLNEQRRIVYVVESLIPKIEHFTTLQANLEELNASIFTKLRKSILQEAIQGRLVPQDPADEPASVLLERIKAEKAKLFKEGKFKKKDLVDSDIFKGDDNKYYERIGTEIAEIELPFSFPKSWEIARFHSICALIDGEKRTGNYICLDAKYLRGKSYGEQMKAGHFIHSGDNIILVDGENSGEVFTAPIDGYMGSTFKQLWVSETLYLPYVLACIRFYKEELRNSKKGAAIPHLNKDIFRNLIVGIPPLQEQERIIHKFDEIKQQL